MSEERIVIIVAAGSGTRMGSPLPKQFLPLLGQPVLAHSIAAFQDTLPEATIIIPVHDDYRGQAEDIAAAAAYPDRIRVISGGHNRYTSVARGIAAIEAAEPLVFVHDGVRCLVTASLIRACEKAAAEYGSAIPCLPVSDSLRRRDGDSYSVADRSEFILMQTPQTFRAQWLRAAFGQPYEEAFTDEATVVERAGFPLHFIAGEDENLKLTRPIDLLLAEKILSRRQTGL